MNLTSIKDKMASKASSYLGSATLLATPFIICPCEKHLISNTIIGVGLLGVKKLASKKNK